MTSLPYEYNSLFISAIDCSLPTFLDQGFHVDIIVLLAPFHYLASRGRSGSILSTDIHSLSLFLYFIISFITVLIYGSVQKCFAQVRFSQKTSNHNQSCLNPRLNPRYRYPNPRPNWAILQSSNLWHLTTENCHCKETLILTAFTLYILLYL